MKRIIALGWIVAVAVAIEFTADLFPPSGNEASIAFAQGKSGQYPMREMMRRMMQGLVPPPGMTAERLPEPGSRGAQLMARYCQQCHDLPSPAFHTAEEWSAVFERMLARMEMMGGGMMGGGMMGGGMMGMGNIETPTSSEVQTLLRYLTDHGMTKANTDELAVGNRADREVYRAACSQCHAIPSPSLHSSPDWPGVVARMDGNMQLMNKSAISKEERESILRFLKEAATKAP